MLNFFIRLFVSKPTVASITEGFATQVAQLEAVAAAERAKMLDAQAQSDALRAQSIENARESIAARRIAANIQKLIDG